MPRRRKKTTQPGEKPYYEPFGYQNVPQPLSDLAIRRVRCLAYTDIHRPLQHLLANAYIIGLQDAVEVLAEEKETS